MNNINSEDIAKPQKYICGKNYLQRYYLSVKKISEEKKEGLQMFAKPKIDCLLKEDKFRANQKAKKTHSYIFKKYDAVDVIMKYLSEQEYYCYNINVFEINQIIFLIEYFFIDLKYNLFLSLKTIKEEDLQKVIGCLVSNKENEFYKINGGV
jgi:hypothetical protein